jgi:chromosome segregation ATPase
MSLEHAEALALQGNEKMSEETVAELESLREGSKTLHEEVAKLKFTIQQKEVEYGQLRLQLEKSLAEQTTVARGQATEAESALATMQGEMSRLERELKQKDRLLKEQESDLQREAARYSELYEEVVMSRQRLQDGDKKFREQVSNRLCLRHFDIKMIIYQDRLGTNIGKVLKKRRVF